MLNFIPRQIYKLIVSLSVLISAFFILHNTINAQVVHTQVDRSYTVGKDKMHVEIKKTTSLTNNDYKIPANSEETFYITNFIKEDPTQESAKFQHIIKTLKIYDKNGKLLNHRLEQKSDHLLAKVNFSKDIKFGETGVFTAKYESLDLVVENGNLTDIYIIPFAENFDFETEQETQIYTTKLIIPKDERKINFVVPKLDVTETSSKYIINFPTDQIISNFGWVQLGTEQYYEFKISQKYHASDSLPFMSNKFEITIPLDIVTAAINQHVYFSKFSPEPSRIFRDVEDNLIAEYIIPASQSGEIVIEGFAKISKDAELDIKKQAGTTKQISEIFKKHTAPANYWEVDDPTIQAYAAKLQGDETDVYKLVEKTYLDIVDSIDYSEVDRFGLSKRQGALATLNGGSAVCMEYSDLFITLMRAQGIPARAAYGHGYDSRTPVEEQVGHQWAEVFFPGINDWVAVDVTWGESGQTLIGGDLNHLYTHIASSDPDQTPQVKTVYYGEDPATGSFKLNVRAIDQIPEGKYSTGEDLYNQYYTEQSGHSTQLLYNLVNYFTSSLADKLNIQNQTVVNIVYFCVLAFPVFFIIAVIAKRQRKKTKTITPSTSTINRI